VRAAARDTPSDIATAAVYPLQLLARRVLELTTQINDLKQRTTEVLAAHAPQLLDHDGMGPDTAAVLLIAAGDNPERLHSKASFTALCGVSPVINQIISSPPEAGPSAA
jgi:transposase